MWRDRWWWHRLEKTGGGHVIVTIVEDIKDLKGTASFAMPDRIQVIQVHSDRVWMKLSKDVWCVAEGTWMSRGSELWLELR